MKPIKATLQNPEALSELGRASVQIVHDLKNQVNGLKLYATFLRKRMEKSERPADELETINKIMAGLERAAADMNTLVRFGRPLELKFTAGLDLAPLLAGATGNASVDTDGGSYQGDFDSQALTEALTNVHAGALASTGDGQTEITLRREALGERPHAVISWSNIKDTGDAEMFTSFNGGTGLRLALAARIIEAHGGAVAQEPGALRVRLPLGRDEG